DGPLEAAFDLVLGNPPYLRKVNVPKLLQDLYAQCVPDYAIGDMLHSFLDRAARTLRPGGKIGFVASDRWLSAVAAATLREQLGTRLGIQHLSRLDPRSSFYRPKQRTKGTPPRIHPVAVVLASGGEPLTRAPVFPGSTPERYAHLPTLQQIAQVRIAPWLGTPGVFELTAAEAKASGIPDEFLVRAVDTSDLRSGVLGPPTRFAIRTDANTPPHPSIAAHLQRTLPTMAARGRQKKCWWVPPEVFSHLDLTCETLVVPRIARGPKTFRLPPNFLAINHNLSIVAGDSATLNRVERALGGQLAADWISEHAPRLENGYFSITTSLLRNIPIDA
ncbi:MAG: Eco57I restriction-modification methylase domain-containing protein, partial [Novosphingobium sp.]|nr:Eco57I restriction-modification methylase domain-containing protein [Novosphingobium sp.]